MADVETSEILAFIESSPLLRLLPPEMQRELASILHVVRFHKRQVLFSEGMPADTLFFVKSGRVKVYRLARDGRVQIVHVVKAGDAVTLVPFLDRGPYPANAEMMEDGQLVLARAPDFDRLAAARPELWRFMAIALARRLREVQEHLTNLGLHDAHSRMATLLLQLARDHGQHTERGIVLDLDLTRQDLGSFVGVSRETATRVLNAFRRSGAIELGERHITILDEEELASWREA